MFWSSKQLNYYLCFDAYTFLTIQFGKFNDFPNLFLTQILLSQVVLSGDWQPVPTCFLKTQILLSQVVLSGDRNHFFGWTVL